MVFLTIRCGECTTIPSTVSKKLRRFCICMDVIERYWMVEAAGIEPASANPLPLVLHA